jgi:hypothetical protein
MSLYTNYEKLNSYLGEKSERPAPKSNGKTTRVIRGEENDWIGIKLHRTIVIKHFKDGSIELNSGGWNTRTTRDKINTYSPPEISVYTKNNIMYLRHKSIDYIFEDKMCIKTDGSIFNQYDEKINPSSLIKKEKTARKELKQIKEYCKAFADIVISQKLENPGPGDCWCCLSHVSNSDVPTIQTLHANGKVTDGFDEKNHIKNHIKAKYYVPSLFLNAFNQFGDTVLSKVDKHNISWYMKAKGWELTKPFSADLTKERIIKLLSKYIRVKLGY